MIYQCSVPHPVFSFMSLPISWYIRCLKEFWSLQWCHNGHDGVSNRQPRDCLLNRLTRRRSKKTSKLRVTGLCAGNSTVTGEFTAQRASNEENVSIWWRHQVYGCDCVCMRTIRTSSRHVRMWDAETQTLHKLSSLLILCVLHAFLYFFIIIIAHFVFSHLVLMTACIKKMFSSYTSIFNI